MKGQEVLFSTGNDNWSTPQWLYDRLDSVCHFNLDPAADHDNHKTENYFTIEDDGLAQSWYGWRVFLNCPYTYVSDWTIKCGLEAVAGENAAKIASLQPARPDTRYFQDHIFRFAHAILFLRGRLKFGDAKNSAPFPSCVVFYNYHEIEDLDWSDVGFLVKIRNERNF